MPEPQPIPRVTLIAIGRVLRSVLHHDKLTRAQTLTVLNFLRCLRDSGIDTSPPA